MATVPKLRVLVVEDDIDIRRFLQIALEHRFDLTVAATAEEAWTTFQAGRTGYDVVLADIRMPGGMDGLELTRKIARGEAPPRPPVILVTAYTEYHETQAVEAGAAALVFKPFSITAIEELIEKLGRRGRASSGPLPAQAT